MKPARQVHARPGSSWTAVGLRGATLLLAGLAGCSTDVSPGKSLLATRLTIDDSQLHEVAVTAPADMAVVIAVSGRGVDVRAWIKAAQGHAPSKADAPNRRMGSETLLVEPGHAGAVAIVLERNDHSGARGDVEVTAYALPLATDADRRRLEAARLEARACLDYPDIQRAPQSAEAFAQAAALHARIGDDRLEGLDRLQAAGVRYTRLADWLSSAALAAEAGALLARAGEPTLAAFAMRVEGAALDQRANESGVEPAERERLTRLARERLTGAHERLLALGNPYEAGYALNYRGVSYHVAGERDRARSDYLGALELFRAAGDRPAQALSLQSLALQSYEDGRLSDAMQEFDQALALIPRDEDPENYAHTLHNSAWPLRAVGRLDDAMARFYEAGETLRRLGDRNGEARALHGLATTLMFAGEPERAAEMLEAAIRLRGETGARREQAVSLLALGQIEQESGQLERSIAHLRQAESLVTAPAEVAKAKLFLARAYLAAGRIGASRTELDELMRLGLPPTHRDLGLALAEMGELESRAGRADAARTYFSRSLDILAAAGSDLEHARTRARLGEARLREQDFAGALTDSQAALAQLEGIGQQSLQAESRAAFRASYRDAVELQIEASLGAARSASARGRDAEADSLLRAALLASDRARAHLVADAISARTGRVPAELLKRREGLYERLAGKRQQRDRLTASLQPDESRVTALTRHIALLRTEATLIEGEIAKAEGTPTAGSETLREPDLAARLPDGLVVAEYFVGRRHAWLFEVRRNQVAAHEIGDSAVIDRLARALNLAWRAPWRSAGERPRTDRELSRRLFGSLREPGSGESLYLVPDGSLHLIPMAVLAQDLRAGPAPAEAHVATTIAALVHGENRARTRADRLLAVVADPIYSSDDRRIREAAVPVASVAADELLTRHARDLKHLQRLPSTAVEAAAIYGLAAGGPGAIELIGADATREKLAAAGLQRYRIVHFATHAFADSEDPALATLALSRFDLAGRPLDGDLRSLDIVQWRLNADLVVLSACNTAVGREIAGEAPLGLSQAFLRGGAQSVLATLWQVPDASTARLMEAFYREMLVNGERPAAALALAQQSIRKLPRWSDPYFWAGFQLISNARFEAGNNNVERRGG